MPYYRSISSIIHIETKEKGYITMVQKAAENLEVGYKYYVKDIAF